MMEIGRIRNSKANKGRRLGFQEKREKSIITEEKVKKIVEIKATFLSNNSLTTM
ncbi:MAG: hypothetical protein UR42_C0012G0006 [Candidatus Roizmanbacteria bacterium GW2011_GWA2_33_33]|uniref:Uncharacterized protein n=1 Tax=Candidatus Roizmanbacteria bacterium GW2011_GWA2_33_33 TaxID=1618476 RepID=A0A0G0D8F7_9BACT|nr:MAG: hypothetical protein UR42_C0012G0006 [Candidatus Roizmanbacteria bacterium GW2011_GWA2_33_33]